MVELALREARRRIVREVCSVPMSYDFRLLLVAMTLIARRRFAFVNVCRELGVNTNAFEVAFWRSPLPQPRKYLNNLRLLYAAYLIDRVPGITMLEVSEALRYGSYEQFRSHVVNTCPLPVTAFKLYSFDVWMERFKELFLTRHRGVHHFRLSLPRRYDPGVVRRQYLTRYWHMAASLIKEQT